MRNLDVATMQAALVGTADPEIVECEAQLRDAQLAGDDSGSTIRRSCASGAR